MRCSIVLSLLVVACGSTDTPAPPPGPPEPPDRTDLSCSTVAPDETTVTTEQGSVRGVVGSGAVAFKGIPFAAPPVGERRFKPPEAADCFDDGLFEADDYGAACAQASGDADSPAMVGSEDCLVLNVWKPSEATGLPVLFYVHGGGNVQGSTSQADSNGTHMFDGAALASMQNAIVVTSNYRLGLFGFMTGDDLAAESDEGVSGNYGLLDQIAALQWVQRNISEFGGDPQQVLLFGESAGALDTCMLVNSPLASGLFNAALMQSGACFARTADDIDEASRAAMEALSCGDEPIACMRGVSAEEMVTGYPLFASVASSSPPLQPHVDGYVLPEQPHERMRAGRHNRVPLVIGANSDETGAQVPQMSEVAFNAAVLALAFGSPALAQSIKDMYPVEDYASYRAAYVQITTDAKFVCTARYAASAAHDGQSEPVYRYLFSHALDNGGPTAKAAGAFHGLELPFVFHQLGVEGYQPTDGEVALSQALGGYWARFASGDPNGAGAPHWPEFDPVSDAFLQLDVEIVAGEGIRTAKCDFWDTIYNGL